MHEIVMYMYMEFSSVLWIISVHVITINEMESMYLYVEIANIQLI